RGMALEAESKAHFMGTSKVVFTQNGYRDALRSEIVLFRPFPRLGAAPAGRTAIEAIGVTGLAGLTQISLADATAIPAEAVVAEACAKRLMRVLGWLRQLPPTVRVAAAMAEGRGHHASPFVSAIRAKRSSTSSAAARSLTYCGAIT